jgi:hypothetical protein
MKKYLSFLFCLLFVGCVTGSNGKVQTNPQISLNTGAGSTKNTSIQGTNAAENMTINYNSFLKDKGELNSMDKNELKTQLEERDKKIASLQDEVNKLREETKATVFRVKNSDRKELKDGKYETTINLEPIGSKVIPILTIECATQNNAKIESFIVEGNTIPAMYYSFSNNEHTSQKEIFNNVAAGDVTIKIITDKDPGILQLYIDPFTTTTSGTK